VFSRLRSRATRAITADPQGLVHDDLHLVAVGCDLAEGAALRQVPSSADLPHHRVLDLT
jgi:hypothetical protein